MTFTTFEFILFFSIVVIARLFIRRNSQNIWLLLLASISFYALCSWQSLAFILFTTLADFFIARKIGVTTNQKIRSRLFFLSIILSIGLLIFFKYANFFLDNFCVLLHLIGINISTPYLNLIQPPAISFYTFASLGYIIDVYYERITYCSSIRDYSLFTTFFPKLLSGPIARSGELLPQFKDRLYSSAKDIETGLVYVLIGAVQKLVIADQVAVPVGQIFANPQQFDAITLLMGLAGYTIQLYCDFAGYSSMAIGFARLIGINLPENFQIPFSSTSITEFWRRWHITLSKWFRDYVFLPLEIATRNNPRPNLRICINQIIMMTLVGLWHGPSWNFVVFGMIHGISLAVHRIWVVYNPLKPWKNSRAVKIPWTICAHFLTLGVVLFANIFFRTENIATAFTYMKRIAIWEHSGVRLNTPFIPIALIVVFLAHIFIRKDKNMAYELPQKNIVIRVAAYSCLLLILMLLGATASSPFIYFQF